MGARRFFNRKGLSQTGFRRVFGHFGVELVGDAAQRYDILYLIGG